MNRGFFGIRMRMKSAAAGNGLSLFFVICRLMMMLLVAAFNFREKLILFCNRLLKTALRLTPDSSRRQQPNTFNGLIRTEVDSKLPQQHVLQEPESLRFDIIVSMQVVISKLIAEHSYLLFDTKFLHAFFYPCFYCLDPWIFSTYAAYSVLFSQ